MRLLPLFAALAPCVLAQTRESLFLKLKKLYDEISITFTPDGSICLPSNIKSFYFKEYSDSVPSDVCCYNLFDTRKTSHFCLVASPNNCQPDGDIMYSGKSDKFTCMQSPKAKYAKFYVPPLLWQGLQGSWISFNYRNNASDWHTTQLPTFKYW
ncbi:hypothetical protein ACQY0O_005175 [Thecaphora frezii]